jgi:PAS domain S-box-containing protein
MPEERPQASAESLWAVLDDLPVRISYIDRERRLRYANRQYATFIGLPLSDILGKTVAEIYGKEEEARLRPFSDRALRGETVDWEGWVRFPGGIRRYVQRTYKPHRQDTKRVAGYFVLVSDTTEHRQAETEQHRLAQLLRDAIENIPNGFAVYDASERLVACNVAFASLFGVEPQSLVGASTADLVSRAQLRMRSFDGRPAGDDGPSLKQALQRLREADHEPVDMELDNGQWLQITSHPTAGGGRVYIRTDITRLKNTEALLRDSERRFRDIVERNPLPVWVNEIESGRILYESPAASTLVGRNTQGAGPGRATDYYADIADRSDYLRKLREHGEVDGYELRLRKVDGTEFWASITARIFRHEGRELAVVSMVDLTERKAREAELRQARETLEDAIESLAEGFVLWDADSRLVMCNQRYKDFNYLSADMLVPGVRWEDFMRAGAERGQYVDAIGRVEEYVRERKKMRAALVSHYEFQQSDDRWLTGSVRRTRQGGLVVIRVDATERKRMEQALRESEARFRSITIAHPVPLAISTYGGKMLYVSQPFADLFRMSVEEALKKPAVEYYKTPEGRAGFIEALRETGSVDGFEVETIRSDGSIFWASLTARRSMFEGQDAIVTGFIDLTERRAAERELARQREALHQSEKLNALGGLLAGVAHELNNPLSVVVGQSLLLRDAATDPKTQRGAERIANAADRCSRIVKTFLAMARQNTPSYTEANLNDIVESALGITEYALRSADIEVRRNLADDLPPVWGDSDQLTQVVMNLLINAEQAMAEKIGKRSLEITTSTEDDGKRVRLSVRDSGPGIAPEIRTRIFEPFFTTKGVGVGTGVGLSVSHAIVDAHQGTIGVESTLGKGATFVITLPQAQRRPAQSGLAPVAEAPCVPRRVLVVDDEPEVRELLADILSLDGHQIEVASSGNAALRILAHKDFDIILSDMRMPDVDGPGLYTRIKNAYPHLIDRLIFITGDALGPSVRAFLEQTGLPCLEKPFDPKEVRQVIGHMRSGVDAAE